ncbi:MAG: tryptophan synthase subunit beta [Planctomycetes bacterium]|nr:tryptophan synthase subunit beta [Planctomycetota bacterium]MBI3832927.1 tryptophan synthase subunit beta [Planctomycetota bacterium]
MGRDDFFGRFGGQFVPETVIPALEELDILRRRVLATTAFRREYVALLSTWAGRPTPILDARRLADSWGGRCRILLKREDLNHTGAHKVLNALGQGLLAQSAKKHRIVCETGAGQHGVATASVCALLDLSCTVYMGALDIQRQAPNVVRMRTLGAEVIPVESGSKTLKDATNEAIRDWVTNVRTTHYLIGSVVGPHPYPLLVRTFASRIGREALRQVRRLVGRLPHAVIACVGGGSNAIGIMHPFIRERAVDLIAVEAGGRSRRLGSHAASLTAGRPGVLHGAYSYLLQDDCGQVAATHSVSAGLDYPGVGPELSELHEQGRLQVTSVRDNEAIDAFYECTRCEGILPALECAHALAFARREARTRPRGTILLINLSGRGDKDVTTVASLTTKPAKKRNH